MAISNVLQENSYGVVDNIAYSKQNKYVSFSLSIFEDSSKTALITCLTFSIDGKNIIEEVEDIDVNFLPKSPEIDKRYIISGSPGEALAEFKSKTVWWNGEKIEESSSQGNIVWVNSKKSYYKVGSPSHPVKYTAKREFDQYFDPSLVDKYGLLACCYKYVASLPLAKGASSV